MKKSGAYSILITILLGLLTWAGASINNHSVDIAKLKERSKTNKEILIYIRNKVDKIESHIKSRSN